MGYKLYLASAVKTFNPTTVLSSVSQEQSDLNDVHLRSKKQLKTQATCSHKSAHHAADAHTIPSAHCAANA